VDVWRCIACFKKRKKSLYTEGGHSSLCPHTCEPGQSSSHWLEQICSIKISIRSRTLGDIIRDNTDTSGTARNEMRVTNKDAIPCSTRVGLDFGAIVHELTPKLTSKLLPGNPQTNHSALNLTILKKIPLTPMGVLAPVSAQRDTPLSPPSTSAEIFRRTCLQSSLKKN
jgi:hypothetical protein